MDVDGEEPVKGPETRPNGLIKAAIKGILSNRNNNDKPDGASVYKETRGRRLGLISRLIGKSEGRRDLKGLHSNAERSNQDRFPANRALESSSRVFVRNLPPEVSDDFLKSFFGPAGTVSAVKIDKGSITTAFVSFVEKEAGSKAVELFHKKEFQGRTLKVSLSVPGKVKPKFVRSATGSQRRSIFERMG